jgi:hypothetical protein
MEGKPFRRHITWRRPNKDLAETRETVPYSWAGWMNVHMRRWQYWPVWNVTQPWRFRVVDGCSGEHPSKLITLPFLGAFVWFFNRPCDHNEED